MLTIYNDPLSSPVQSARECVPAYSQDPGLGVEASVDIVYLQLPKTSIGRDRGLHEAVLRVQPQEIAATFTS